jgi:hypothetical protein
MIDSFKGSMEMQEFQETVISIEEYFKKPNSRHTTQKRRNHPS